MCGRLLFLVIELGGSGCSLDNLWKCTDKYTKAIKLETCEFGCCGPIGKSFCCDNISASPSVHFTPTSVSSQNYQEICKALTENKDRPLGSLTFMHLEGDKHLKNVGSCTLRYIYIDLADQLRKKRDSFFNSKKKKSGILL
ncbi:hypothetical protein C1645_731629 [Glomus cerebriforme]|uniref:Hydrophobin n=1 Tax=Glomus cerebriforme TaxID=658196 RepID=A0A397TTY5_9GLOM|nr:hypothetical protein C1645_731629 [Glomus cerebriforme]